MNINDTDDSCILFNIIDSKWLYFRNERFFSAQYKKNDSKWVEIIDTLY